MGGVNYGHYNHEIIEQIKELTCEFPEFFHGELYPEWTSSPVDTGERFGLRCVLKNDSAYTACHEVDRTEVVVTAVEVVYILTVKC